MKPQQVLFGTRVSVSEELTDSHMILADSVTTSLCAVKAYAAVVSAMEIDRIPILAWLRVPPWGWTVVMLAPHDVMQTQGSHVVDERLM